MAGTMLEIQRTLFLDAVKNAANGEWKVLIMDEESRKLVDNVVKEDDILANRVMSIEMIEDRRPPNPDAPAVYIISPQNYIIDCIMSDMDKRKYKRLYLLWTSLVPRHLRERIDKSALAQSQIAVFRVLNLDYYPREHRLITLRDPYSFPILFHPECNNLVQKHIAQLAERIMSVCVALGEYPTIRYYTPPNPAPTHEAHVLSSYIADAVQKEIDIYAKWNNDFEPTDARPRGALYILDRSIDIMAPFIHEFTYQAMAHDLLPIREGDKITYKVTTNEGRENQESKDVEISDKDEIWVKYRHMHMSETLIKLDQDFKHFLSKNRNFADRDREINVGDLKDMLAGLPEFHEGKDAYTLHSGMAEAVMDIFGRCKLAELAVLEQTLATGLDEDFRKPKNVTDQVVRMLDEPSTVNADRLRLIALYILFRNGLLSADIQRLLQHSKLPVHDEVILKNLELLGARITKPLKDTIAAVPLFPAKPPPPVHDEAQNISRYEPALKRLLEDHVTNTLSLDHFPYVKPELAPSVEEMNANMASASLRSVKSTWASRQKAGASQPRQRIIIFMAGGATYSEIRSCYEISERANRDIFLLTSHMLNPGLFLQQLGDLSADRRQLGIPADRPAKKAPAHLFEKPPELKPTPSGLPSRPTPSNHHPSSHHQSSNPVPQMASMNLNGGGRSSGSSSSGPIKLGSSSSDTSRLRKDKEYDEKKKKHHFFSSKR